MRKAALRPCFRHHADRIVGVRVLAVLLAAQLLHGGDDRGKGIGVVGRGDALHDGGGPLQAHARIHVGRRERCPATRRVLVELHEHQVPQLQKAPALAVGAAVGIALAHAARPAEVVVDLAARPAGAFSSRRPPVVLPLAEAPDALGGDARLLPEGLGLVILQIDRGPELLRREGEHLRHERPCPGDRLTLEVVAHAEVAEHLEEGEVALVAHLVDIGGPEALLDRREPRAGRCRLAGEIRLERHHARAGEQERGVAGGDERGAGHHEVTPLLKKVKKSGADVVAGCGT